MLGFLGVHEHTHHGKADGGKWHWNTTSPSRDPRTYKMVFPTAGPLRNCPAEGCQGQAAMRTAIRVHFLHRHVRDTMIILEEGNLPHPHFPRCDIMVP